MREQNPTTTTNNKRPDDGDGGLPRISPSYNVVADEADLVGGRKRALSGELARVEMRLLVVVLGAFALQNLQGEENAETIGDALTSCLPTKFRF